MSLLQLNLPEAGTLSCRTFFDVSCRRAMKAYAGRGRGRVSFVLSGIRGGTWTLDFEGARVLAERIHDAELALALSEPDFMAWLNNRLDVVMAYRDGRLAITGSLDELKDLAAFMAFAAGQGNGADR